MSNTEDKTLCALQEEGYIESNIEDMGSSLRLT